MFGAKNGADSGERARQNTSKSVSDHTCVGCEPECYIQLIYNMKSGDFRQLRAPVRAAVKMSLTLFRLPRCKESFVLNTA